MKTRDQLVRDLRVLDDLIIEQMRQIAYAAADGHAVGYMLTDKLEELQSYRGTVLDELRAREENKS